ncbi:MAG: DUF5060 domain-containing protein [Candidatus Hinthialibacter antarcticus]|nr:DUF5060 domain-containing protein [Candidatus Hinthialibacter antarcticus]
MSIHHCFARLRYGVLLPLACLIFAPLSYSLGQYEIFEAFAEDNAEYENPFDSDIVKVDATITAEFGETFLVPCFYTKDNQWGLRYAASEPGTYQYKINAVQDGAARELASGEFTIEPSDEQGFIRVGESGRYFVYDNGDSYFPLGENMGWVSRSLSDWTGYLDECHAAKINWIRIWMVSWGYTELVWSPQGGRYHGLDAYDLDNAALWDGILQNAKERGITVTLVVNHHGQYSNSTNPIWDENPYNKANGGYLNGPSEFFTDERAKKDYRDKLRYLVGRYGAFTNLMAWEFWNEVDLTSNFDMAVVRDWHEEMAAYLASIDPYDHLRSTSGSGDVSPLHRIDGIDYAQTHSYTNNLIERQQSVAKRYFEDEMHKPHFFSEMAYDWRGPTRSDKEGVSLHNQLWSSVHSYDCGTAMTWWWDNWIRPADLYHHFRFLADYIEDVDWEREQLLPTTVLIAPQKDNADDFTFIPEQGWGETDHETFEILPDGTVDGLNQATTFIHGNSHRNMAPNPVFQVTLDAPREFTVQLERVARAGAALRIYVNDALVRSEVFAASSEDTTMSGDQGRIVVSLAEGENSIKIRNVGADWVELRSLSISQFVQRPVGFARGAAERALVWIQDRAHRYVVFDQYPNAETLQPTTVKLPGYTSGEYRVVRFDPWSAARETIGDFQAGEAGLEFPLHTFTRDVAYQITRRSANVKSAKAH